jgi:GNAT superfamily N-acetyltransferase
MNQISLSQKVVCRPAMDGDQADVTEFCKGIWEGGDYVPDVWEQWFRDPNGILAVAEYNGHAVGCSKVSRIAEGQWWLEGFRVDPEYQGRKVGFHLHQYVVDWWLENGDGVLRLMTDGQNYPIHHLCEKTGFRKTGEVCGYRAAALAEKVDHFTSVNGLQTAAAFAVESESIQTTNGLSDFGWRICRSDEEVFKKHSSENTDYFHSFYWWKDRQGMFSVREEEDEEKKTLILGVVACALEDMPALLMDVRRFAADRKFDDVFQIAFDMPQIISPLLAAGFEKRWKRSNAFIFEKNHSLKE